MLVVAAAGCPKAEVEEDGNEPKVLVLVGGAALVLPKRLPVVPG